MPGSELLECPCGVALAPGSAAQRLFAEQWSID